MSTEELQSSNQVLHESQSDQENNHMIEVPLAASGSVSNPSNDNRKVSRQDIVLVQNLIERCLQLYMNKDEVAKTLLNCAKIHAGFTNLVWKKLEEENVEFFRAYYIRLKLKKQILLFNHLLEHHYHLMKYPVPQKVPLTPMQNEFHPVSVNYLPMGYPVLQRPPIQATAQHHLESMGCGISSFHMLNGVPAPRNYQPLQMSSGNDVVMERRVVEGSHVIPPGNTMSSMSKIPLSPTSVASSDHFPFTPSELSGAGVETSTLDSAFTSDVTCSVGMQLLPDGASRSFDQYQWNFSLSDLTEDLTNLGDFGSLGNYSDFPFLPSESEILLDSPEQKDTG